MAEPLFAYSYMKLERARAFIAEIKAELDRYRADDPYSVSFVQGSNPPQIEISWKGTGLLPAAILGDTVHNLRTALDLMASELGRITSGTDKDIYFPFANTADDLSAMVTRRNFHKCGSDAVALLETLKPYKGGNIELRAIHDLDINDKHKALLPSKKLHQLKIDGSYNVNSPELGEFRIYGDVEFEFDERSPLAGRDLIQTLENLVQLIEGILKAFAALVTARA